jgi:hypothetical protein
METDLLVNPKMMGMTNVESIDLPTLDFNDVTPEISGPKLVPTIEETGPTHMGGMANLNAEPYMTPAAPMRMSDDHVLREKYDMLRKFERLGKMGVPMRKRFTIDSPLDEMKLELEFIKREKSMDATIKQFSEWFVTGMSAAEWGSKNVPMVKAFGLQLDGLSEAAQMNVVDLEDDFEELYDLYGENMKMHPLVRIPLRVCMMVYMVHLTNQMAQKAPVPNIQDIMRQNPDIARQLAGAAMQSQTQQMRSTASVPPPPQAPNPLAGLMSFMQQTVPPAPPPNLVPKPPENKPVRIGVQKPRPAPAPAPAEVKPPPNINDLLKEINSSVSVPTKKGRGSTGKSVSIKL